MSDVKIEEEEDIRPWRHRTYAYAEAWNKIVEVASRMFIDELKEIHDDRDLTVILAFTAKLCDRIDSFQKKGGLTTPKSATWFTVIRSWLRRNKST